MIFGAATGAAFGFAFFGGEEFLFAVLKQTPLATSLLLPLFACYLLIPAAIGAVLGAAGLRSLAGALWLWAGFMGVLLSGGLGPLFMGWGMPRALGVIAGFAIALLFTVGILFVTRESERMRWGALAGAWTSGVIIAVINGHLLNPLRPATLGLEFAALLFAVALAAAIAGILENRRPRPGSMALLAGLACWILWVPVRQFNAVSMPADGGGKELPPVLVLDISGLRADQLGGASSVTPNLDALAARSIVYQHAQAASSWTGPGFASLVTGMIPSAHGARSRAPTLRSDVRTLAEYLSGQGVTSYALVSSRELVPKGGFDQGFGTYRYVASVGHVPSLLRALAPLGLDLVNIPVYADAATLLAEARRFVRTRKSPAWFLTIQLSDLLSPEVQRSREGYRAALADIDAALPQLLDALPADAWIFVVSDHGTSFGEHNVAGASAEPGDGGSLHQELLDTPLIAYRPRNLRPLVVNTPVSTCDLFPTILSLAHLDSRSAIAGRGLNEALGFDEPADATRALIAQGTRADPEASAVLRDGWKYIELEEQVLVFNLKADPGETRDLADTPEGKTQADDLSYELPGRTRPSEPIPLDPNFLNRYEAVPGAPAEGTPPPAGGAQTP